MIVSFCYFKMLILILFIVVNGITIKPGRFYFDGKTVAPEKTLYVTIKTDGTVMVHLETELYTPIVIKSSCSSVCHYEIYNSLNITNEVVLHIYNYIHVDIDVEVKYSFHDFSYSIYIIVAALIICVIIVILIITYLIVVYKKIYAA